MSNEKKKFEMDRREFLLKSLRGVGTGMMMATPLEMFLTNVMSGMMSNANALAAGVESGIDNSYVHLTNPGGPSRWFFDLALRPNGNDAFVYNSTNDAANSMLITRLVQGTGINGFRGEYATTRVGQNYLPHLWSGLIATPSGSAPMANLAQKMVMMRGISALDSHELGRYLQAVPVGNASLLGLVGDNAKSPIPVVGVGGGALAPEYYYSDKGVGGSDGSGGPSGPLSPFTNSSGLIANSTSAAAAIDNAINAISALAQKNGKSRFVPTRLSDKQNASKLMKINYSGMDATFNTIQAKYQNLISRSFGDPTLRTAGIDDVLITGAETPHFKIGVNGRSAFYTGTDLRNITTTSTNIANLARGMAVAEFMLTGGGLMPQAFSSSIHIITGGGVDGVKLDAAFAPATATQAAQSFTNSTVSFSNDAHEGGAVMQMRIFSAYYRAIASCWYELYNQLGERGKRVVGHTAAEFNRQARDNSGGADHGAEGHACSFVSGNIAENIVVGNIKIGSSGGTWGVAAPMDEFLGQTGLIGNMATTMATMLEFKTPTENNPSYVTKNASGQFVANTSRPKNVA